MTVTKFPNICNRRLACATIFSFLGKALVQGTPLNRAVELAECFGMLIARTGERFFKERPTGLREDDRFGVRLRLQSVVSCHRSEAPNRGIGGETI